MRPTLRLVPSPPTNTPEAAEASPLPPDRLADAGSVTGTPKLRLVPAGPALAAGADVSRRCRVVIAEGRCSGAPPQVRELAVARGREDPLSELTARERQVLTLMAEGRSNTGIARQLRLTRTTVEKHVRSIFVKLDLPASGDDNRRVLAVTAFLHAR